MLMAPRRFLSAVALLAAIACGDDDDVNAPTGTILITAAPANGVSIAQGGSGTITVTLIRGGGFSGPVDMTVEGLPSGITATVTPTPLTGATTNATVTVNVASTVAAGAYTATLRGSATGVGTTTVNYTVTVTAAASIDYQLSATPAALSIAPGGNAQTTVNIARTNFTGAVTFSLENPQAGITATFDPAAPTTNSTQATISVAASVAPGNYNVQIKGAATGLPASGDRFVTVAVTVAAAANFTLAAAPAALNLAPGASGNSTITITRTNLTADVALSLASPPPGITGVFTPATFTGTTLQSTLALTVGAGVAAGNYTVTVQGVGGSPALTRTATVTVTVTGGGGGGNIVWEFCNTGDVPLKFWRLSGTTWAEVTPTVGATTTQFAFTIASASGGVAYTLSNTSGFVARASTSSRPRSLSEISKKGRAMTKAAQAAVRSQDGSLTDPYFDTQVFLAQTTELSAFRETCITTPTTVSKTFNVSGQVGSETGFLGYDGASASLTSQTSAYNLNVVPGTYDYLAAWGPTPTLPDLTSNFTNYRIGRGEAAPGAAVAINRTGAPAFVSTPFTVSGGNQGSIWQFLQSLEGARGEIASFPIGPLLGSTGSGNVLFLAPADRLGTDLVSLAILNTEPLGNNLSQRSRIQYIGSAPPQTAAYALPPAVPAFTVTGTSPTWTVAGAIPTGFQVTNAVVNASITGAGETTLYSILASRGWLSANGQGTNYSLSAPILPGFLPQWGPAAPLVEAFVVMFNDFTSTPAAGSMFDFSARLQSPP
jgi:hypothetical protein